MEQAAPRSLKIIMALTLLVCALTALTTRHVRTQWGNVPPVPSDFGAITAALGDKQYAYRAIGIMLQSFGNTGGRFIPLKDYNYETLSEWFNLEYRLDKHSDFTPMLAAFYFGASQDPKVLRPLIEYLGRAGNSPEGEKWRWLAHAVYLSRFKLEDNDLALELAYKLAAIPSDELPVWARQMPANVLNDRGDKEAALELILQILASSGNKIHPNEVNALNFYMCKTILDEAEAQNYDFCKGID